MNINEACEVYGIDSVENFDSEEEIKNYFSKENLVRMFGTHQYDVDEAEEACELVSDFWRCV